MKRILFFINNLSSGGAEHQLCELASALSDRGYNVFITTFGDIADHYKYSTGIIRHHIAPFKGNIHKYLSIWFYFLRIKTDWVISFGQRENYLCLLPLLFRSRSKLHVIAGERNTTTGKPTRQELFLLNFLYRRADYIVPNSSSQRNYIIRRYPSYCTKTVWISNFTDLSHYQMLPLPRNKVANIGIFGRYTIQKNCLRFVEAIKTLRRVTNQKFVIKWYGNVKVKDQPNPMFVKMLSKVEEYGLKDCLILNDHIADVAHEMKQLDAICLPSLWEGFSNAISEAICCGRPCLVSDVADNSIMVQDGINGFLFNPTNIDSIVSAFLKYFSLSQEDCQQMSMASRRRAEELFNRERFVGSYVGLIDSK